MSESLVTGIAPASNMQHLEQQLQVGQKLDSTRLAIISKASRAQAAAEGQHGVPGGVSTSSMIMTGSGGTGVPGVGGSRASLSSFSGHGPSLTDYLGGLPMIPPDQAHNYNVAIAEGRSLVTYKTTSEEAPEIEAFFRQAGLRNVRTFRPR